MPEGLDFKKDAPKPTLESPSPKIPGRRVLLDWYPKIQSRISQGVTGAGETVARNQASLKKEHLAFFDWDSVYWELQDFKNDRAWFNLNLERDNVVRLLSDDSWYTLLIPPDELVPTRFDRVRLWQSPDLRAYFARRTGQRRFQLRWWLIRRQHRLPSPFDRFP